MPYTTVDDIKIYYHIIGDWNTSTNAQYFKLCLPFYAKKAYTPDELGGCIQNPELWAQYMKTEHGKFDFTSSLHKITCPVLHLAGENDPVHPATCAIETAKHIGENCQLAIIKDTGDPVYRDKPEETIAIITGFLSKLLHHEPIPLSLNPLITSSSTFSYFN